MRGLIGIVIIISYYGWLGFNSSIKDRLTAPYFLIVYTILLSLFLFSAYQVNNNYKLKRLIIWVVSSILPTALISYYSYFNFTGGWISFGWDFGLWEFVIPLFFGLSQIITIIFIKTKDSVHSNK